LEKELISSKKIIFLSLVQIDTLSERGIYHDLLRQFVINGHEVIVVCPVERRTGFPTRLIRESGATILQVRTLNLQKSPICEKGLGTATLNFLMKFAIKKHLSAMSFDLILYATPPITLIGLIDWLKRRDGAKTYLLLKDIFPQNAVDISIFGRDSFWYSYFRKKELSLYALSDRIGCMSPANVQYLCADQPYLISKVEMNPNSIDLTRIPKFKMDRNAFLAKWNIPKDAVIFLYGGNLGKPQGTPFLLNLIQKCEDYPKAYFLIVGDGTDYPILSSWFNERKPKRAKLIRRMPKEEFDRLAAFCDVGLILLRREFTIPNFPSRLLTYLENKLPILAITDKTSDVGSIAEAEGFGKWCLYGQEAEAIRYIQFFEMDDIVRNEMGQRGFDFMARSYDVKDSYFKIINLMI
jgi:glycosyltransferase involved in cell wall biosynthesis